jgi:hypothetical protein
MLSMIDLLAVSHDRHTIHYQCPRAGSNWGRSTVLVRRSFFARRSQRCFENRVANFPHVVLIVVGNVLLPHGAAGLQDSILSCFRLSFRIKVPGNGSAKEDWVLTVGQETQSQATLRAGAWTE